MSVLTLDSILEAYLKIPFQLIMFTIPSLLFIAWRMGGRKHSIGSSLKDLGWTTCRAQDLLLATGACVILAVAALVAFRFIPAGLLQGHSIYTGWRFTLHSVWLISINEAFYIALGEEVFFRGFLGGLLFRRFGFAAGNLVQASVFLLPHLLLLYFGKAIWPIFIVVFTAGWLQGWLRFRSGSILPGWLVHTLTNVLAALSALR